MANNIEIGQNIVFAIQTISFVSCGITALNTLIIYSFDPTVSLSYIPGRTINGITGFVSGKSYLLKALDVMDLTLFVYPPYPTDVSGEWTGLEW